MKNTAEPFVLLILTRDGTFTARYSAKGLVALAFPDGTKPCGATTAPKQVRSWHQRTTRALGAALAGHAPGKLPPLDLSAGTAFQQRVWEALRRIARGQTRSYGELARVLGQPGAARAVGGACGANPVPVLVPCHRVLATNGELGGFSGGLRWKRLLLAREGGIREAG